MERKLTAILSADVEGYGRLMGEDEEATVRTLTEYREVMGSLIERHRGRVIDSPGDNLLAQFGKCRRRRRMCGGYSKRPAEAQRSLCGGSPHAIPHRS